MEHQDCIFACGGEQKVVLLALWSPKACVPTSPKGGLPFFIYEPEARQDGSSLFEASDGKVGSLHLYHGAAYVFG